MITSCVPIVTVASRAAPLFAATEYDTLALPVPEVGVNATHAAAVEAVHVHSELLAVTARVPVEPFAVEETEAGDTATEQPPA